MARLLGSPKGLLLLSTAIAVAAGVAIVAFGAAPKILVPVTFASAAICMSLGEWAERKLGRR